jgi:hypothetical protein
MSDLARGATRLTEVRATFSDPSQMEAAAKELTMAGFDRADLSLPTRGHSLQEPGSTGSSKPVETDEDARQARTLGTSTAASAAALAAAGAIIATGGAAIPAVAGAVLAGGLAGGATFAATGSATGAEQQTREDQAASGRLVMSVRTMSADKVETAKAVLFRAGGADIQTVEG